MADGVERLDGIVCNLTTGQAIDIILDRQGYTGPRHDSPTAEGEIVQRPWWLAPDESTAGTPIPPGNAMCPIEGEFTVRPTPRLLSPPEGSPTE